MVPERRFLGDLEAADVRLHVVGNKLRVNAPAGLLTTELKARPLYCHSLLAGNARRLELIW
jgi:hypothetical protein